jgi:hypothetical protein
MNQFIKLFTFILLILLSLPGYSASPGLDASLQPKNHELIDSYINKSLPASDSAKPPIQWLKHPDGGATASIEYKNNKIEIPFTHEEINAEANGSVTPDTVNKIHKFLSSNPGGDGPDR